MDSQFVPGISEDPHLLFQVDEFYDILKSDGQNIHAFGELDSGYMGSFDDQLGDIFADMNNDDCALNDYNTWTGIQIREREPKPTCPTLNHRVRLRTSKMESRNGESLSGTIQINQDFHLDPLDEKQPTALDPPDEKQPTTKAKPASVTLSSHRIAVRTDLSAKKRGGGLVKGVWDFFGRCSSASKKCLVLCTCMMGTAALIFCFLLRDVCRFFGSFSAVKL
ncbi:uncharacterized protein A4U43_C06F5760 [Asparagus officinalis]|uniref:Uncharacterized protein n=1 Tax=Asparagus officinalis TaxID=4686 RepID=A0A5P1EN72_ASPOF|nr:uncharacterized protein A4U43_C06F5760 [Asparagus officinalis]